MISANELKKILEVRKYYNDITYLERVIDKELVSNPVNIKDGVSITISGEFNDKTIDLVIKKYMKEGEYAGVHAIRSSSKGETPGKTFFEFYFFNNKEDNL